MAPTISKLATFGLFALSGLPVDAFWRMPCRGRVDYGRVDPIVDYGRVANHAHTVQGSGGFGMSATYDDLVNSDCTSCGVKEDKSAYWTASMHFEHPDGTTEIVPQVGGMLAYYLLYGEDPQPFPAGFKMIAGNYTRRAMPTGPADSQEVLSGKALGFNCLHYDKKPEPSLHRHQMPSKEFMDNECTDGIRLEIMFPSCWNGKDLDTPDQSHLAYPSDVMDGECPEGHDTRLVSIFYETIWNTHAFAGKPGRFTLSTGDVTGYGNHGDFMMGWEEDFLASAVKTCTNLSGEVADCPLFTLQDDAEAAKCKSNQISVEAVEALVDDNCEGPRHGLCGDNPIGDVSVPEPAEPKPAPSTHIKGHPMQPSSSKTPTQPSSSIDVGPNAGGATRPVVHTPKPQPKPQSVDSEPEVLSTTTYTSDGAVYDVVIEQVETTVIATETATAGINRRHLHHHAQAHHWKQW